MSNASADSFPFVRNDYQTCKAKAPASVDVKIGDLLFNVPTGGTANAFNIASNHAFTSAGGTQHAFGPNFLGIATEKRLASDSSSDKSIVVATEATVRYPCSALAAGLPIGQPLGVVASGSGLLDQRLGVIVSTGGTNSGVIGKLAEAAPAGATDMLCYVKSSLVHGQMSI